MSPNDRATTQTGGYTLTLITPSGSCLLEEALVDKIADLTKAELKTWLADSEAAELHLSVLPPTEILQQVETELSGKPIDIALQPSANRKKQALIADMDSTMIDQECVDELAAEIGIKERVAAITARAMNGEIEFEPALRERVALLRGLSEDIADKVIESRITLAKGGKTLLATMKANGTHTALVSGGFTLFTGKIAAMLGFDENHANILETLNGKLTGTVKEPILGAQAKVDALNRIAGERNLVTDDFIAVGDGANDLPMLQLAGTGVALHAKPAVAARANIKVDHGDLTSLLYLQGYRRSEFRNPT